MALDRLTKVDGGGISTTSDYRVGIITATKFVGPIEGDVTGSITATDGTFSGNVTIGGTLTYEDVTNIDSVGIITAQSDIHVGAGVSVVGIVTAATFKGDGDFVDIDVDGHTNLDNVSVAGVSTFASSIYVADSIIHEGDTNTKIDFTTNVVKITADNKLRSDFGTSNYNTLYGSTNLTATSATPKAAAGYVVRFRDDDGDDTIARFHNTNIKNAVLEWSDYGSSTTAGNLVFRGFVNGVEGGRFDGSGNFKLNQDLDVDGHTNLDNVSIAGVTTVTGEIKIPDLSGSSNKISLGTNQNLQIYYDNSSYITNGTAGHLFIKTLNSGSDIRLESNDDIFLMTAAGSRNSIICRDYAQVELYHDNVKTAFTGQDQWIVYGRTSNSGMVEIASNQGANNNDRFRIHKTSAASRLSIQNYSTGSWVENIRINAGGAVELKHADGTTHLETTSTGVSFNDLNLTNVGTIACDSLKGDADDNTNITFAGNDVITFKAGTTSPALTINTTQVKVEDDQELTIGTGNDLKIFHDNSATNNVIEGHTGSLNLRNYNVNSTDIVLSARRHIILQTNLNETAIQCLTNGATEIFHDGGATPKLRTTATGIEALGEVAASQDYPDFKPALDLNFAQNQTLDPRITYSRVGTASYTDENGRFRWVGSHVPRFDHEPSTGKSKGLLVEAAGTNLMKGNSYSYATNVPTTTYFSNTNGASGVLSTDILAPDGSGVTMKVHWPDGYSAANNGYVRIGNNTQIGTLTAGDYAFSFFVKRGTDGAHNLDSLLAKTEPGLTHLSFTAQDFSPYYAPSVAIRTDTNTDIIVEKYPDGWYRVSNILFNANQSWSPDNTGVSHYVLAGNNFKTYYEAHAFYYWGFQLEKNPISTSYIGMTVQEQTSRAADSAVIDGENFDEFFNHNGAETNNYQGTLIASLESPAASSPSAGRFNKIQLEQNNDNKVQLCVTGGGSPYYDSHITYGTATQADFTGSQGSTFPTVIKHGVAFAKNNAAYSYNGNTVETDNSVNVGGISTATHGKYTQLTIGGQPSKAHIKRVMYYSQRISDTQLRNLTS